MYMNGLDRHRRPVVIFRPTRDIDSVGSVESKVRFFVWVIEYSIFQMDADVDQMTWYGWRRPLAASAALAHTERTRRIIDMNGYSVGPSDLKRVSLAKALITTLQNQYPERVAKCVTYTMIPDHRSRFLQTSRRGSAVVLSCTVCSYSAHSLSENARQGRLRRRRDHSRKLVCSSVSQAGRDCCPRPARAVLCRDAS